MSCFALNRKFNLIAYTERNEGYHPHIRVCRLPEGGSNDFKRLVTIEATHGDEEVLLDYSALAFSSDGRFMAACGGVPSPSVTVWDWAEHQARCTIPLPALAESVSFDPYDRYLLCVTTSKGSRLIRVDEFASTPAGCEVLDMSTDSGAVVSHAWLGKHRVSSRGPSPCCFPLCARFMDSSMGSS